MSASQVRRLAHQVNLGLTSDEAAAVDHAAKIAGISHAAFARRHLLAAVGKVDTTPARRSTSLPPEDVTAIAVLSGNLGRAAGATVLLAKALRAAGDKQLHDQAESLLALLRRHDADLTRIIDRMR